MKTTEVRTHVLAAKLSAPFACSWLARDDRAPRICHA